jgi:hypothetical protein
MAFGQLGNRYFVYDTLAVTVTAVDTTWSTEWEVATIYADTVALYIKVGAPDVGGWSERPWIYLPAGLALSIGPTPKLKRLSVKTFSGSGVCYIIGYKKTRGW